MGPGALKTVSAAGTVIACGVSAALVATDPKPDGAPLTPPVRRTVARNSEALAVPPSCPAPNSPGSAPTQLPPALQQAYDQLRQAQTPQARQAVLATLPADQRQQLVAYTRQQQRRSAPDQRGCSAPNQPAGGDIAPSIRDAPAATAPDVNSYVS